MHATPTMTRSADLFAWTDGQIVLLVERNDDAWVIARGWRKADRLTDVRRWRFACERKLVGQMRRLVHDQTLQDGLSAAAAHALAAWLPLPIATA